MLLLARLVVEFVPNVVGSAISVHMVGRSMNWVSQRYASSLNHLTTASLMCQSWDCLFEPQQILLWFCLYLRGVQ